MTRPKSPKSAIAVDQYPRPREEAQADVCRRIMEGQSVRSICRRRDMPSKSTVMNWLATDPEFRMAYALAKQLFAETLSEEMLEISDDTTIDWKGCDGERVFDHEHVQRAKLRVDTRKWLAAKLSPKRFGESSTLRVGELDADRRLLKEEEIVMRIAAIVDAATKRKGR